MQSNVRSNYQNQITVNKMCLYHIYVNLPPTAHSERANRIRQLKGAVCAIKQYETYCLLVIVLFSLRYQYGNYGT